MILKFPDLNTLRLALITGGVPVAMSQAGAVAGFDQDQCWVETSASLGRNNQAELKKLGVQFPRAWAANLEKTEVSCWAEILPLERERAAVERLDQTPVLFDLPSGEELARLGGFGRLRDYGVPEDELREIAEASGVRPGAGANPRPATPAALVELLRAMW